MKFRVIVFMGQSNMYGTVRACELKPPYLEKPARIRICANGRGDARLIHYWIGIVARLLPTARVYP
jgi:hypothetical protein